jgi:hypothetical protein
MNTIESATYNAFPSIEQFRSCLHDIRKYVHAPPPTLMLHGTVKLHGTHADVVVTKGADDDYGIWFQSRNRVLTIQQDNCGFAMHMEGIPKTIMIEFVEQIAKVYGKPFSQIMCSGEWCGANIQQGVALSKLPKMFVVFSVKIDNVWQPITNYKDIEIPAYSVYSIMRGGSYTREIDLDNPDTDILQELTLEVEKECPFAMSFGVSGVGEGVVWNCTNLPNSSRYWFKTKGDKHAVSRVKTLKEPSAEEKQSLADVAVFVENVVTPARLNQGLDYLREMNKEVSKANTGAFITWVDGDVFKEEKYSIVELKLDAAQLKKRIGVVARDWYFKQCV